MDINKILKCLSENETVSLKNLVEFLKIPSISTDKKYKNDCKIAANWISDYISKIGFQSNVYNTDGHPIVLASAGEGNPHLLFYGHYDVQPVDPLNLWNHDPFSPKIEKIDNDFFIKGRGASDDKGQLMTFVEACDAFFKAFKELPFKITILLEGEEECGSPSLLPFLKNNKDKLNADYALICDTGMWDKKTPSISTKLRGMMGEEICLTGPNKDLHSGMYGGPVVNPIKSLCELLSKLHDSNGKILIPHFYDDIIETNEETLSKWKELNFSDEKFFQNIGLSCSTGEKGYSTLEKIWTRPTCEINGIWGGYTDEGFKTVIPSQANAKISFRLVDGQDPEKIRDDFQKYIIKNLDPSCKIKFISTEGSKSINTPIDTLIIKETISALNDEWGKEPVLAGCGGSIPIVSFFKEILNLDSLLVGFAQDDDQIHSPNEKYDLNSFIKGKKSWARILYNLKGKNI